MKPSDFLLSVLDFFAVLLPGALATWLAAQYAPRDIAYYMRPGGGADATAQWTVFVLGSYLLGNFVFMAGSRLDPVYDRWRKRTKPTDRDSTFKAAKAVRKIVTPEFTDEAFSLLQWTNSYIRIHSAAAGAEIERLEATSKFFRGMVVMSVPLCAHFFLRGAIGMAAVAVALGMLSYERYRKQRWKATELSYGTAVILHAAEVREARKPEVEPERNED